MKVERKPAAVVAAALLALLVFVLVEACRGSDAPGEVSPSPTASDDPSPTLFSTPTPIPTTIDAQEGIDDGQQALREGRYDDAAALFAAARDAADDGRLRAAAATGAGATMIQQGDEDGGLEALRAAMDAAPGDSTERRRAAYLLGTRLNDATEFEAAADVLEPFATGEQQDALAPYIDATFAAAAVESGDRGAANDAWDRALATEELPDSLRANILQRRAALAEDDGDTEAALGWLAQLVDVSPAPATRFELGTRSLDLDDTETFQSQMLTLVTDHPGSDYALRALEALGDEGTGAPLAESGYVYYRHRQYETARTTFARALAEEDLSPQQLAYRTYYLAASYEDDGYAEESIPLYDDAAEFDPDSPYTHRARYWAARATETTGDTAAASQRYTDLAADGPPGEFSEEAAFRAGYTLLSGDDPEGAIQAWEQLGMARNARVLYWQGRAHASIDQGEAATAAYGEARDRDPFGFYGLEATRQLGEDTPIEDAAYRPIADPSDPDWNVIASWLAGEETDAPGAAQTAAGDFLLIGLRQEARQALQASAAAPLAIARGAWELGLRDMASRQMSQLAGRTDAPRHEYPRDVLKVLYPLDYVTLLDGFASEGGFSPLLFAGLIRTESAWNPGAISVANAIGLTQVIPTTGEAIARALGYDDWSAGDLTRPAVSLAFGANYIATQLERFEYVPAALAAYNAGPGNAETWLDATGAGAPADYVEEVAFSETRGYIELVMSAWAYYERAWGSE